MSDAGPITLRGIVWDNDRAVKPLTGTLPIWQAEHPDVQVDWSRRPLSTFAHQPLTDLVDQFDLVILDHPHIGEAVEDGLILPVDRIGDEGAADDDQRATVGPSFESYRWNGRSWAFPIDAASQVAARRSDLLPESQLEVSPRWSRLIRWARDNPSRLGLPFTPVLAFMCLFSICAGLGEEPCSNRDRFVSRPTGRSAMEILRALVARAHAESTEAGDVAVLDAMAGSNEIAYVPLVFLYSNFSRPGYRANRVVFENIPSGTDGRPAGGILGGAGLAVSSRSAHPAHALEYGRWLMSPRIQAGPYVEHFGQPGSIAAWDSPRANELMGDAFTNTRRTLDLAYLRPTHPGYIAFQEAGSPIVREGAMHPDGDVDRALDELDRMYRRAAVPDTTSGRVEP